MVRRGGKRRRDRNRKDGFKSDNEGLKEEKTTRRKGSEDNIDLGESEISMPTKKIRFVDNGEKNVDFQLGDATFVAGVNANTKPKIVVLPPPLNLDDSMNHDDSTRTLLALWNKYLERTSPKFAVGSWSPTSIQRQMWSILTKTTWNTIGIAPTSSGKTLSYAIPTLLSKTEDHAQSSVVVLVPTRELVQQVASVYKKLLRVHVEMMKKSDTKNSIKLLKSQNAVVVQIHGGVCRDDQIRSIVDAQAEDRSLVVVATPGRLLDILEQQSNEQSEKSWDQDLLLAPHRRHWIVLDEADHLTKKGDLGPQVNNILTRLSVTKGSDASGADTAPRLVFVSATMSEKAQTIFQRWMNHSDHVLIRVDSQAQPPSSAAESLSDLSKCAEKGNRDPETLTEGPGSSIPETASYSRIPSYLKQMVHVCSEHKKPRKLVHTLQTIQKANGARHQRGIVFYSKIEKLEYSCKLLKREGLQCLPLHGQLSTVVRQSNLHTFASAGRGRDGEKPLTLLLATDVAARGIDIPGVDFVIQYDFPGNLEQYIHRCGRAGRSSAIGNTDVKDDDSSKSYAVYSFFTRNLQRMAGDLVNLLQANGAWVDPNLRELVQNDSASVKPGCHSVQTIQHSSGINRRDRIYSSSGRYKWRGVLRWLWRILFLYVGLGQNNLCHASSSPRPYVPVQPSTSDSPKLGLSVSGRVRCFLWGRAPSDDVGTDRPLTPLFGGTDTEEQNNEEEGNLTPFLRLRPSVYGTMDYHFQKARWYGAKNVGLLLRWVLPRPTYASVDIALEHSIPPTTILQPMGRSASARVIFGSNSETTSPWIRVGVHRLNNCHGGSLELFCPVLQRLNIQWTTRWTPEALVAPSMSCRLGPEVKEQCDWWVPIVTFDPLGFLSSENRFIKPNGLGHYSLGLKLKVRTRAPSLLFGSFPNDTDESLPTLVRLDCSVMDTRVHHPSTTTARLEALIIPSEWLQCVKSASTLTILHEEQRTNSN